MKYDIIYIDPPWYYNSRKSWWERGKIKFWGGAGKHYTLMKPQELKDFKTVIDNYTKETWLMFMWVTMPLLEEGIDLLKHWWYKYKTTAFTW